MPLLISLSGLPGVGKTTLAKALAPRLPAIHLRVDTVEAALKNSTLNIHPAADAGYLAIAALAKDNLLLGHCVIVDTVNPMDMTRNGWTQTATQTQADLLNVEVICTDKTIHRARVEARQSDITGMDVPTWAEVQARDYQAWTTARIVIDTATGGPADCTDQVLSQLASHRAKLQ